MEGQEAIWFASLRGLATIKSKSEQASYALRIFGLFRMKSKLEMFAAKRALTRLSFSPRAYPTPASMVAVDQILCKSKMLLAIGPSLTAVAELSTELSSAVFVRLLAHKR